MASIAAVGWSISAVSWIASPIISKLINRCCSHLGFDASKKLKELGPKVLQLERVMEVVEESPCKDCLEQLYKDLKSAFYEAENILDDIEYHRLERKIQGDKLKSDKSASGSKLLTKEVQSAMPGFPQKDQESGMSKGQLEKSLNNMEQVIHEACNILQQLDLPSITNDNGRQDVAANSRSKITTSAPPLEVFGRDDERDKIVSMLHEKECDGQQNTITDLPCHLPYSVVGIHGIAGSGKSTLAQFVCAREKKDKEDRKDGHFHIILWVHVSQKFDLDAIYRELLEGATGNPCPQFSSRNTLQQNLEKKLHAKRIFLVLDDVWYDSRDGRHQEKLQQILSPLRVGKTGSKILVTSRTKDALLDVGAVEERCIPISDLDHIAFYEMFMHYALRGARIDDHHRTVLEMIGADIAKKLKRSPLAARTVGAQLSLRPNVQFWKRAKDRDLLNETMGALWWSYQHLDEQVRRCFAYCSIYPRRRHFKRDKLVQLWMAEGFIKTSNDEEELDAVGQDYFEELLSASFLQLGERRMEHGCEVDYFTVHDLLRDLAEEAARGDCFRIEKGFTGEVPRDVRHLFVGSCDRKMFTEKIFELRNLRTLIFDDSSQSDIEEVVASFMGGKGGFLESMFRSLRNLGTLIFDDSPQSDIEEGVASFMGKKGEFLESMFRRLRKLRVFSLSISKSDGTISLPACIGQLKHLRYIYFESKGEARIILPDSIAKLYHIQHLEVFSFGSVVLSNSQNVSHLINLRHVSIGLDGAPNIGMLRWLQMLPGFSVRNKPGYELRQLKDLNKLKGELGITGLGNVQSKEEAIEASLAHKEWVTKLVLCWEDTSCSPEVEAEVLEALCPSKYLERLEIRDYRGSTYPNWMVGKQNGGPEYLRNLWFYKCSRLQPARELFEVFVHLRWFRLWFSNWFALPDSMEQLNFLQLLDIKYCPNIRSLPALPRSLQKIYLTACNEDFIRSCQTIGDPNWEKIQHIPDKYITFN